MKKAVVFGGRSRFQEIAPAYPFPSAQIDAETVHAAVIDVPSTVFDAADPANADNVFVRVTAFSCNYRDKSYVARARLFPVGRFVPVGSEFAGYVVDAGSNVSEFSEGQRVVSNHHFVGDIFLENGVLEGVVTNRASQEYHVVHKSKLLPIPQEMDDTTAAAFSLNAQTAYSMIRKMDVRSGHTVLLTSATSNVALFLMPALKARGATIYAATTSKAQSSRLKELGAVDVVIVDREAGIGRCDALTDLAVDIGLFDRIFDPFFDLHIRRSVDLLRSGGAYCTCGLLNQSPQNADRSMSAYSGEIFAKMMVRNLTLKGNCIGLTSDLNAALDDYVRGKYRITIDSVYSGSAFIEFLVRTFSTHDRFGKVVFTFSP